MDNKARAEPRHENDKYSLVFKYFKEGKTPFDVVMDGILDPDEAERLYEQFKKLSTFKVPERHEKVSSVKLSQEEWKKAFRAYRDGFSPIDLVINENMDPEKAEYAYVKFLELSEKYVTLSDHEWSLAFYFFDKGYKPLDLATRGVLNPYKAKFAYEKYLEMKGLKREAVVKTAYVTRSKLDDEIPDRLVVMFFIASVLVDIEHITAAIALMRSGTFGNFNPILALLSFLLGPKIGLLISMILLVGVYGGLMFVSALYLDKKYQDYPLLAAILLELAFTISHAIYLS